jgi:hypothetical protein
MRRRQLAKKVAALERDIAKERGNFSFFALFVREDSPNHLDLVAAAPWLKDNEKEMRAYLAKEFQSRLDHEELLALSAVVFLHEDDPKLKRVQRDLVMEHDIDVEHGIAELRDEEFFDMGMKRAYIITSKRGNKETSQDEAKV